MDNSPGLIVIECALLGLIPAAIAYTRCLTCDPDRKSSEAWRVSRWWLYGAVLFIVALPHSLLAKRPGKEGKPADAATIACAACGGMVSTAAAACPHCGHPLAPADEETKRSKLLPLVVAAIAGGIVIGLWYAPSAFIVGLPDCESASAKNSVDNALANAPFGKVMGLRIIAYANVGTVERTDTLVRCSAQVALNNASTHMLGYVFEWKDSQIFVRAEIDGQP